MGRITQRLRSLVISWAVSGCNWATSDRFFVHPYDGVITWKNRLGWWLEGQFGRVLNLAFPGSDEEIEAAWDTPLSHLSERQLSHIWPAFDEMEATCNDCQWSGSAYDLKFSDGLHFCCPECLEDSTYLDVHGNTAPWCREVRARRAAKQGEAA